MNVVKSRYPIKSNFLRDAKRNPFQQISSAFQKRGGNSEVLNVLELMDTSMVHLHVGELLQKATTAAVPFLRLISEDCRRVELPLKLKLADLLEKWELTVSISGKQHAMKHEETNLLIFFFPLKKVSEVELTVFSFLSFPLNYKVRL